MYNLSTSFIVKKLSDIDGELSDDTESDDTDDSEITESFISALKKKSLGNELIEKLLPEIVIIVSIS
jgi:hypothetical protein